MQIKESRNNKQEPEKFKLERGFYFFLFSFFVSLSAKAQCAMCRASLESEGNKTRVEAVNDGIILLMAVPYIIVGLIGFAVYRMYFKKSKDKT